MSARGNQPSVFLSYASRSRPIAHRVRYELEAALGGRSVWSDADLNMGDHWSAAIEEAFRASSIVVVLFDAHALASEWGSHEIAAALDLGKPVIPVQIEDVPSNASLPDWLLGRPMSQLRSDHWDQDMAALVAALQRYQEPSPVNLAVVGRMRDSVGLAEGLAGALESHCLPARCWGSGSGGAPLATAAFLGATSDELRTLGQRLAGVSRWWPARPVRRFARGWTLPDGWVAKWLTARFDEMASVQALVAECGVGGFGELTVAHGDRFDLETEAHRPAGWLQLIALDLEARRPALLPRHLDEIGGGYSQKLRIAELLAMAMAGLDGPRPVTWTDGTGRARPFTQYPGFWPPWSMEAETGDEAVLVLRPDETARSSSYWWGAPVDEILTPEPPPNWLVLDVAADSTAAKTVSTAIEAARAQERPEPVITL